MRRSIEKYSDCVKYRKGREVQCIFTLSCQVDINFVEDAVSQVCLLI